MDFRLWLFKNNITLIKVSRDLNYSYSQIVFVASGKRNPGRKLANLIYEYTKGEVEFPVKKRKSEKIYEEKEM